MSTDEMMVVVVGMAAVTFIPRLLPFLLLQKGSLPPRFKLFLTFIPYAMLGALIIPGVFTSTGDPCSAVVGLITAILLSLFRFPVIIPIIGAILSVYMVQFLL